jgi:hypothetical protein
LYPRSRAVAVGKRDFRNAGFNFARFQGFGVVLLRLKLFQAWQQYPATRFFLLARYC